MGSRSCRRSSNTTRSWCSSSCSASGIAVFVAVALAVAGSLAVFWAAYHVEIVRGWANIPTGPYNTDLFAAKNLPFLIGLMVENAAAPSRFGAALGWVVTGGLYGGLAGAALAICRRLSRFAELARRHRRASRWRAGLHGDRQRGDRRMLLRRTEHRVSRHFPVARDARAYWRCRAPPCASCASSVSEARSSSCS